LELQIPNEIPETKMEQKMAKSENGQKDDGQNPKTEIRNGKYPDLSDYFMKLLLIISYNSIIVVK
jgi:hypothetical protein